MDPLFWQTELPQRNSSAVCKLFSKLVLYTNNQTAFVTICSKVEFVVLWISLDFHLKSFGKSNKVIDHNCLPVFLPLSCSCCDDWPIKARSKQTTLHRKHTVTNLDLLLLEPDSVSTHYPPGPHDELAYHTRTHTHTHTLLQIGKTHSHSTETDTHYLHIPYHLVSVTHTCTTWFAVVPQQIPQMSSGLLSTPAAVCGFQRFLTICPDMWKSTGSLSCQLSARWKTSWHCNQRRGVY